MKAGDLAMIVVPMPCGHGQPGYIFRVGRIEPPRTNGEVECMTCGKMHRSNLVAVREGGHHRGGAYAMWRLKRIPPLSELEGQPTQEDIHEPA